MPQGKIMNHHKIPYHYGVKQIDKWSTFRKLNKGQKQLTHLGDIFKYMYTNTRIFKRKEILFMDPHTTDLNMMVSTILINRSQTYDPTYLIVSGFKLRTKKKNDRDVGTQSNWRNTESKEQTFYFNW